MRALTNQQSATSVSFTETVDAVTNSHTLNFTEFCSNSQSLCAANTTFTLRVQGFTNPQQVPAATQANSL